MPVPMADARKNGALPQTSLNTDKKEQGRDPQKRKEQIGQNAYTGKAGARKSENRECKCFWLSRRKRREIAICVLEPGKAHEPLARS